MLVQIIPIQSPLFAVFTDERGNPDIRPVMCLGVIEVFKGEDRPPARVVAGYCVTEHIDPADFLPHFVGYDHEVKPERWSKKCKEHRAALIKAAEKAEQSRIYVPDKEIVGAFVKPA